MDESIDESLHPNWVALATVKYRPQIFVKSTGTEDQQETSAKALPTTTEIDDSASLVYNEILEMPSTAQPVKSATSSVGRRRKRAKIERINFCKENLFRLAMDDDVEGIQRLFETAINPEVNAFDHYGWTALMMAACEGSANAFQKLLWLGADLEIADKKGNTASTLAEKKGFQEILSLIDEHKNQGDSIEISDDEDTETDQGTLFCSDCGIEVAKATSTAHQSSVVHLFSCKFKGNTDIKTFGIAKNNRGYQMMRRTGWDGNSALGSKQNGKLYPIKTVIRKRGTGLGIAQDPAKITHFKANDPRSIKFRPPPRAPTRKEILENDQRDKRHERRLRRALS